MLNIQTTSLNRRDLAEMYNLFRTNAFKLASEITNYEYKKYPGLCYTFI